jgi:tetratricopeptide (TPR) repeat protein
VSDLDSRPDADALEDERDFLLRSLDDLETERAEGNVDDDTYRELHDDYTARAAATIRAMRDGVDARPRPEPLPLRRRVLVITAIVVLAVVAGVSLAAALGARLPGQTGSGNTGAGSSASGGSGAAATAAQLRAQLEGAVKRNPGDSKTRLAYAEFLERDGNLPGALEQYLEVARRDRMNAIAQAQAGRILYLTAQQTRDAAQQKQLLDQSRARFDLSVAADPGYADVRYYRAVARLDAGNDAAGAIDDAQRYLVLAPGGQYSDAARQVLAQAGAPAPTATTVPGTNR